MSDEQTDLTEWVFIRATVEPPGGVEEDFQVYRRAEWDAMTEQQRDALLVDIATTHQENVAPSGAQVVEPDQVPDEFTEDPAKWA